jgi:hypothetical protein
MAAVALRDHGGEIGDEPGRRRRPTSAEKPCGGLIGEQD